MAKPSPTRVMQNLETDIRHDAVHENAKNVNIPHGDTRHTTSGIQKLVSKTWNPVPPTPELCAVAYCLERVLSGETQQAGYFVSDYVAEMAEKQAIAQNLYDIARWQYMSPELTDMAFTADDLIQNSNQAIVIKKEHNGALRAYQATSAKTVLTSTASNTRYGFITKTSYPILTDDGAMETDDIDLMHAMQYTPTYKNASPMQKAHLLLMCTQKSTNINAKLISNNSISIELPPDDEITVGFDNRKNPRFARIEYWKGDEQININSKNALIETAHANNERLNAFRATAHIVQYLERLGYPLIDEAQKQASSSPPARVSINETETSISDDTPRY